MIAAGSVHGHNNHDSHDSRDGHDSHDSHDNLEERRRYALLHCAALLERVEPLLRLQWERSTRITLILPPGWETEVARAQEELRVVIARCAVVLAEIGAVSR